jgi:hypothetical protein
VSGEAEHWVADLAERWTLVRDTRVVESTDLVNYRLSHVGELEHASLRKVSR